MHRFFLTPEFFEGDAVSFPKDIAHQIRHVLRLDVGDRVAVLDNSGLIYTVVLELDRSEDTLSGRIEATHAVKTEPRTDLALYFGLSSREKVEWILQKGTEIGVSAFHPFVSSRSLVKNTSLTGKKLKRWERIIQEAAEQSGRGRLPVLNLPEDLVDCFQKAVSAYPLCLIAWESAPVGNNSLAESIKSFAGRSIALFVGPEGGFSEEEVILAKNDGCQVVTLGARILRMETAAIVFPALVFHELGDL